MDTPILRSSLDRMRAKALTWNRYAEVQTLFCGRGRVSRLDNEFQYLRPSSVNPRKVIRL